MPRKEVEYTELFVLMLDGKILTPAAFEKYWNNYGSGASSLYGWRPPKKIYYTLGQARCGLSHVPAEIKSKVEIYKFVSAGVVSSVADIIEHQKQVREKRQAAYKKRDLEAKRRELESTELHAAKLRRELESKS